MRLRREGRVSFIPLASASVELPVDDQSFTSWVPDGRPQRPAKAIVAVQGPPGLRTTCEQCRPRHTLVLCCREAGKEPGECTGRLELPYGYAGAMPGLKEWVMDRRGEMVRFAVRCRPGPHLASAVLPGALRHAGEAAYIRCGLPDLGCRPREGEERVSGRRGTCG